MFTMGVGISKWIVWMMQEKVRFQFDFSYRKIIAFLPEIN